MPTIVVTTQDGSTRAYPLMDGTPLFIGRTDENDIELSSPSVSRRHAVVAYSHGICGIKDLGSSNGTYVNGSTIKKPLQITRNDSISIANFSLQYQDYDCHHPSGATRSMHSRRSGTTIVMERDQDGNSVRRVAKLNEIIAADNIDAPKAFSELNAHLNANPQSRSGTTMRIEETAGYIAADDSRTSLPVFRSARLRSITAVDPDRLPSNEFSETDLQMTAPHSPAAPELEDDAPRDSSAIITPAEAESVIPLNEPEPNPTLVLEKNHEEEAFQAALENLIEPNSGEDEHITATNLPAVSTREVEAILDEEDEQDKPRRHGGHDEPEDFDPFNSASSERIGEVGLISNYNNLRSIWDFTGLERIPIPSDLMKAVNKRLKMLSHIFDLENRREAFRLSHQNLNKAVLDELARQDAELERPPSLDELDRLIARRKERSDEHASFSRRALEDIVPPEEFLSSAMREARDMALEQWKLLRDANREALPPLLKEAYRLAANEPLAHDLTEARIRHGRLMGGSIYLLVLERLLESAANKHTTVIRERRILKKEGPNLENKSILAKLGKLGRLANTMTHRDEIREADHKLEEEENILQGRTNLLIWEMAVMERMLIWEFRAVYHEAASHFIAGHHAMPVGVRAFLRHGVVGFKPWWMREEVRDFILSDCLENVLPEFDRSVQKLNVVYADEYLAAVASMQCTPSPDESLALANANNIEVKTDRAYRRIVNTTAYNRFMEEMLGSLRIRKQELEFEAKVLEDEIATLRARPYQDPKVVNDLGIRQQATEIRLDGLTNRIKRIETEIVESILETLEETEGRFSRGELLMPKADFLIRREIDSLIGVSRRLEGQNSYFLPMAVRLQYAPGKGRNVVNDRETVHSHITRVEQLDPGIFTSVVIPAKKRANRIELYNRPIVIICPACGVKAVCSMAREGMEGGHLVVPTCFARDNIRERQFNNMLADFRWGTACNQAGHDVMNSDTLAGEVMRLRWSWRHYPKAKRERGLVFNEINDAANWRRIYALYLLDAMSGGQRLFTHNPELYAALIGRYIDLPEGVKILRHSLGDE